MNRAFSWICAISLKPIINKIFIEEIKGLGNIPRNNFILVANHQSHLDQIITGYLCVPRRFHMIGQIDKYNTGLSRIWRDMVYFIAGVIPLNRKDRESRKGAIKEAIKVLKDGDILIIYPEGTRSRTGAIQEGKPGVAKIFLKTGIPILPIGIKGTSDLLPIGKIFPKMKKSIKVMIGTPLYFKQEFEKAKIFSENSEEYREIVKKIIEKVMGEMTNLIKT